MANTKPVEHLRVPPQSMEAEQSILGAILMVDTADRRVREVFDMIRPEMFYNASNRMIFTVMVNIGAMNDIDVITVSDALGEDLEEVGGIAYLGNLAKNTPSASNVLAYCEIVAERYQEREVQRIGSEMVEQIFEGQSVADVTQFVERNINSLEATGSYEPTHINTQIGDWVDIMHARCKNDPDAVGYKTGIKTLDDQIGGFKPGWLITLGGRPSHGKTLFTQIINGCIAQHLPTLFFSMEMSAQEIMDRYVGVLGGVDPKNLQLGALTDLEWGRANQVIHAIKNNGYQIYYDETPALALQQIASRVKAAIKRNGKHGLITVDYLGLMQKPKAERDDLAIGAITRGLKQLAKEVNVPILLLTQANREADTAAHLAMKHLYGSSAIEADSDLVLFTECPEVKDPETIMKGVFKLIPAKFRHGRCTLTSYMKRREDDCGGTYYCMDVQEAAAMENEQERRNNKPKSYVKK
ncbi:replicative DNA helicase [Fluctibacter halophilus]|nr:DnaB-like helicase C-terminal domain-containing protein [Aestuariibacter halophilus]